ncbi:hypothetical protein TNCV_4981041 [Trichonephila clavipes]|nr:hypothetical protein TNCV_4981041 [Trichonephila clavipes]
MANIFKAAKGFLKEDLLFVAEEIGVIFPHKDFLKAWNRSATSAASTDAKECITNLVTFLKAKTEGEERINLAMAGFSLGLDENRQSFKKKVRFSKGKDTYSCQFINYSFKGSEEGMCFLYWEALDPRLFSSSEDEFG